MKAMIFAAGLGTRLKPITDTLPKALVPVCGKPLIEHIARKLKTSGVESAVVNVHHFADMIEEWVSAQDILHIDVSDERELLLETGGGVLNAKPYLEGCGQFLIHNVDIISDLDIRWMASRTRPDAMATLLVSDRVTNRYLLFDPDTMRLKGWINVATGEVRSPYPDMDVTKCRRLAFSGIHIMSDTVFPALEDFVCRQGLDHYHPRFPIMDFYLSACSSYQIYGVEAEDLHLVDVGKLETLEIAEKEISRVNPN